MEGSTSGKPTKDVMVTPYGSVAFTDSVALVYGEQVAALEYPQTPAGRRVSPEGLEAALASCPIAVVLDRVQERSSFDASHDWVMKPHDGLGGDRPVEAVEQGRVQAVLSLVEVDFPLPDQS